MASLSLPVGVLTGLGGLTIAFLSFLALDAFMGVTYIADQVRHTMAPRPNEPQAPKGPPPQVPPNRVIREGSSTVTARVPDPTRITRRS